MQWFILALSAAVFTAIYYILVKRYIKNTNEFVLSSGTIFVAAIILLSISLGRGIPTIGKEFYLAVLVTGTLNVLATALQYKTLKTADLSLAAPMLSFTPVFLILTSFIILGELPTYIGILGIVFIVSGSYVLAMTPKQKPLDPFRKLFANTGTASYLLVAFIYSITANFDKKAVIASDVYFGTALSFLIISGGLFICGAGRDKMIAEYWENKWKFIMLGVILACSAIAANTALTQQIVPYVIAIKRLSILFVVLYGIILLKETDGRQRLLGASIMLIGVLAILLL